MILMTIAADVPPLITLVSQCMCRAWVPTVAKRIATHCERVAYAVVVAMHRVFHMLRS